MICEMSKAVEIVRRLSGAQQVSIALAMVKLVAPYGLVEPAVVEPERFQELLAQLQVCAERGVGINELYAECESIIAKFAEDEPEGAGFYAFGAVVAVFYACCTIGGDLDGGVNSAKRFLDLTGAADDDGVDGLFQLADHFLTTRSDASRAAIAAQIVEHAASLG